VLRALAALHALAAGARRHGANEGLVYDWLPVAARGGVVARTWRDALPLTPPCPLGSGEP
jgi:hypothetical protein